MEIYGQLVWNSLVFGLVSAILAASFSLIYSVSRVLHLMHGAVALFGGYMLFSFTRAGIPFSVSFILCAFLSGGLGVAINTCVYEVMRRKRRVAGAAFMIVSLGGLIVLQNLFLAVWGSGAIRMVSPLDELSPMNILGVSVLPLAVVIVGASLVTFALSGALLFRTRVGMSVRAVADHEEMAGVLGVNTRRVRQWVFFFCSGIAGFFGALFGLFVSVYPQEATAYAIDAFSISLVGGLGSLTGALISGVSISLLSNLGGFWLKAVLQNALVFAGIFLFLLMRPQGLFGKKPS